MGKKPLDVAAIKAKIAERIDHKPRVDRTADPRRPNQRDATGVTAADRRRDEEIRAHKRGEREFPYELVLAAVRATDVVLPADLEEEVVTIARMSLEKRPIKEIVEFTGLPEERVRAEIRKLDTARSVAMQNNPELAMKVVETQFDVMNASTALYKDGLGLLNKLKVELEQDHFDKLNPPPDEYEQDGYEDPDTGKKGAKKHKKPMGMWSMKVDSYFKGIETLGKQLDRIGEMTGQLGKHVPAQGNNITQINQTVNFANDQLNDFVNQMMQQTGNTIPPSGRPEPIVDVEAEEVQ